MSKRIRIVVVYVACGLLVVAALAGCGSKGDSGSSDSLASGGGTQDPSLKEFLDADTLTGEFSLTSANSVGVFFEGTGTLWVDGRKFRYSLYEDGELLRDIMSPDGKTAYFVDATDKTSEPSVASVDRYLLEFSEPATASVEDGIDEETGATRVVYSVQQLDDLEDAANAWYTEDVTYLVKDGAVIGTVTRGDSTNSDGSPYDLKTTRMIFSRLTAGETIPPETFELPYPIAAAN